MTDAKCSSYCNSEKPLSHSCFVKNPIRFASIFHAITNIATFSGSTPRSSQNFSIPSGPISNRKEIEMAVVGWKEDTTQWNLPMTFGSSTQLYSSNHNVHRLVLNESSVRDDFLSKIDTLITCTRRKQLCTDYHFNPSYLQGFFAL